MFDIGEHLTSISVLVSLVLLYDKSVIQYVRVATAMATISNHGDELLLIALQCIVQIKEMS